MQSLLPRVFMRINAKVVARKSHDRSQCPMGDLHVYGAFPLPCGPVACQKADSEQARDRASVLLDNKPPLWIRLNTHRDVKTFSDRDLRP